GEELGGALLHEGPRPEVVGEGGVGADEHVVLDGDPVPHRDGVLEGHVPPEAGSALHVAVIADVAVGSDHRSGKDVGEGPDPSPAADVVRLAQGLGMNVDVGRRHWRSTSRLPSARLFSAASSTCRTRSPARPSVSAGRRSAMAARNSETDACSASASGRAGATISPNRYETSIGRL